MFAVYRRDIGPEGNLYMRRWVLRLPLGYTVRLHHILRSDMDRALHDHPMGFFRLLLSGGYTEVLPADPGNPDAGDATKTVYRPRFYFDWVPAERAHRLVLTEPVWTLVLAQPARRPWGFYVDGFSPEHWVDNEIYDDTEMLHTKARPSMETIS